MSDNQRIYKNFANGNFTQIRNEPLNERNLSWKAKGILTYLASLPNDWEIYKSEIMTHSKDGKDSFESGWKELKMAGYVKGEKIRENGKFVNFVWYASDQPIYSVENNFSPSKPDFPVSGLPDTGKPANTNTNVTNTNLNKEEEDINIKEIYTKISVLYEENNGAGRKLLQVYQYLKNANVDIKDIRKIIEFVYENTQYLNAQCIITQHKACVFQAKTDEGLFDYAKYFLRGLEIRYKNQLLENIETTDQFNKAFRIKELPKVPMHNWLEGEET